MSLLEIDQTEVEVSSYVKKLKRSSTKNTRINSKDYPNIQFVNININYSIAIKEALILQQVGIDRNIIF